jgi:hypothetical protein
LFNPLWYLWKLIFQLKHPLLHFTFVYFCFV